MPENINLAIKDVILNRWKEKTGNIFNSEDLDELELIIDQFNNHIKYLENNMTELKNYLKNEYDDLKGIIIILEEKLRNTSRDSFYYNSYLKTLHRYRAKIELIRKILSKIEKSDEE